MSELKKKYGKMVKRLGSGTYGTVKLFKKNNKNYAIKKINADEYNQLNPDFLFEINCFKRSNHNNIIKLYEFFCDIRNKETSYYLVMECGNGNLSDLISKGNYDKLNIGFQVGLGLQNLINQSILTGDIKCENVIYFNDNKVCITDFGLSQINSEVRNSPHWKSNPCYTLTYRAPEIFIGGSISEKAESWAFGIILYTIEFGEEPFLLSLKKEDKESEKKYLKYIVSFYPDEDWYKLNSYPRWEKINKKKNRLIKSSSNPLLDDLISKLLAMNPEERISIFEALKHPYFNSLNNIDIENLTIYDKIKKYETDIEFTNLKDYVLFKGLEYFLNFMKNESISPRIIVTAFYIMARIENLSISSQVLFVISVYFATLMIGDISQSYFLIKNHVNREKYTDIKLQKYSYNVLKELDGNIIVTTPCDYVDYYCKKYPKIVSDTALFYVLSYIVNYSYNNINSKKLPCEEIALYCIYLSCTECNIDYVDDKKFIDKEICEYQIKNIKNYLYFDYSIEI